MYDWEFVNSVWVEYMFRSGLTPHCLAAIVRRPVTKVWSEIKSRISADHNSNYGTLSLNHCPVVHGIVLHTYNVADIYVSGQNAIEIVNALIKRYPKAKGIRDGNAIQCTGLRPYEYHTLRRALAFWKKVGSDSAVGALQRRSAVFANLYEYPRYLAHSGRLINRPGGAYPEAR